MKKGHRAAIKNRIVKLAILKSTGAPSDLAARFDIGERSVKRLIKEIRDEGICIRYCMIRRSYVTEDDYQ